MINEKNTDSELALIPDRDVEKVQSVDSFSKLHFSLSPGNREIITDGYIDKDIDDEPTAFKYKIFIRLNAKKKTKFTKIYFDHCVFEGCYVNQCIFDTCSFNGCRFIGCNFHQSSFSGCDFSYAIFERTQIDDDILDSEAPQRENLRIRFARSLRMNYQQIGDARAVNKAISIELEASSEYLYKSWTSKDTYFIKKYKGFKKFRQFRRWCEFCLLDFIWGNGESILKLVRTMAIAIATLGVIDTVAYHDRLSVADYGTSFITSTSVFFGLSVPNGYPAIGIAAIVTTRLIMFAFLTAILVKRLGRR